MQVQKLKIQQTRLNAPNIDNIDSGIAIGLGESIVIDNLGDKQGEAHE